MHIIHSHCFAVIRLYIDFFPLQFNFIIPASIFIHIFHYCKVLSVYETRRMTLLQQTNMVALLEFNNF